MSAVAWQPPPFKNFTERMQTALGIKPQGLVSKSLRLYGLQLFSQEMGQGMER